jgi:hydroxymethylpyrimidine/phosphomethylpyrimidine kinase
VARVEPVEGRIISETLQALMDDLEIAAIKIGMLGSAEAATSVTAFLKRHAVRHIVLDPVLRSSSGAALISKDGLEVLKERILPQAYVITPNMDEAAALAESSVSNPREMEEAALRLARMGARNVIITGGHLDPPCDLVCREGKMTVLKGKKISGRSTHGTGCAFSTALACQLALGRDLLEAAKAAKKYVESALKIAPAIGKGTGPVV